MRSLHLAMAICSVRKNASINSKVHKQKNIHAHSLTIFGNCSFVLSLSVSFDSFGVFFLCSAFCVPLIITQFLANLLAIITLQFFCFSHRMPNTHKRRFHLISNEDGAKKWANDRKKGTTSLFIIALRIAGHRWNCTQVWKKDVFSHIVIVGKWIFVFCGLSGHRVITCCCCCCCPNVARRTQAIMAISCVNDNDDAHSLSCPRLTSKIAF